MLSTYSSLKKKANPPEGATRGIDYKLEYLSKFKFIVKLLSGIGSSGLGDVFWEEPEAIFLVTLSL
jgi:hypothetical protein